MNSLVSATFDEKKLNCMSNSTVDITVGPNDDMVWDLRFVY